MAKDLALIRIKNGLFISRTDSENQLCLQHNKPKRVVYFFFYVYADIDQKLRTLKVFLRGVNTGNPKRARVGPSCPLR